MVQKSKPTRLAKPPTLNDYKIPGIRPKYYVPVGVLVVVLFILLPLSPTWYFGDMGFMVFGLVALIVISAIGRLIGHFRRH
jgi:hypothetical protein